MNSIDRTIFRDGTNEIIFNKEPVKIKSLINSKSDYLIKDFPEEFPPQISMESYRW